MGFFSNTKAAIDLTNAADAINDCIINGLMPYLTKYESGDQCSMSDRARIRACVDFISSKVQYMQGRLKDLSADKWMQTVVRTVDGKPTAVPGYIAAMNLLCQEIKKDFNV